MSETADPWAVFRAQPAPSDPWAAFRAPAAEPPPPPVQGGIDPITKRPVQTMGNPRAGFVSIQDPTSEQSVAPVAAQVAAGMAGNEDQRKRIFAAQMFPNMPYEQATKRMFSFNGRLAAFDDKGRAQYLDPETPSGFSAGHMSTWRGLSPGNLVDYVASGVGSIPATAGAIVGGMAAVPTSLLAGPALSAAGAATGDALRQYAARILDPQQSGKSVYNPLPDDYGQTAREAGMAALGQFGGALVNRGLGASNPLALRNTDVRRLQAPGAIDDARQAIQNAQAQGVDLSLGQATGNPGLIGVEDVALRTPAIPGAQDVASQFMERQRGQVVQAGQDMLAGVSPATNKTAGALQFADAADEAANVARRQANQAARPYYEVAENAGPVRQGDLAARPTIRRAMRDAAVNQMDEFGAPAAAVPGFREWNGVKTALDDMITNQRQAGNFNRARVIGNLRDELVSRLDNVYPTYGAARAVATPGQRLSATLNETAVGRTAAAGADEKASAIVAPIFRNSNPEYVAAARDAFIASGNQDAWNAGLRAHVQDVIDRTSRSMENGINPAFLRKELIGNADIRENLRAAMTPQQFQGFQNFMDVVTAVARTPAMNSMTAPREMTARVLMDQAEPAAAKITRMLGNLASPQIVNTIKRGADRMADAMTERSASRIAGMLFDPDGIRFLEAMAAVPIRQQQGVNVGAQMAARALLSGRDAMPLYGGPNTPLLASPLPR
ncbi:hypothetical protein UFOVP853_16 [uncultured Caudovirales phage]|uniref:Uncharacterized protein n=1 Tax=uncultured Caudovirales phage TaxID=2100421 RepID=A0A6J5PAL7_9CAUD|nr:hypothetical protein UFOVP853_16 [uncultured Caudovirales phage]